MNSGRGCMIVAVPLGVAAPQLKDRPADGVAVVYGDVYLYHDTHLHPSKFFFLLYVSIYTYNEHVSKQYSYSLIIILLIV
jgi:hypothetical protein